MFAAACLVGVAALGATPVLSAYQVSLSSEARAVPGEGATPAGELDLSPGGLVRLRLGHVFLEAEYAPRWLVGSPAFGAAPVDFSQQGRVQAQARWESGATLQLAQALRYGVFDFGSLLLFPGAQQTAVEPVAPTGALSYLYSNTEARGEAPLGPLTTASGVAAYQLSGGADAPSRLLLPLGRGPSGELALASRVTRRVALTTRLAATQVDFVPGQTLRVGTAREDLDISLSRAWVLGFGGGAGWATDLKALPVARLSLRRVSGARPDRQLGVDLGYGPFLDRVVAAVYPRWEGAAWVTWPLTERFGLESRLGAARSVGAVGVATQAVLLGELAAAYRSSPEWLFRAGVRGAWEQVTQPAQPFGYWNAFVDARFVFRSGKGGDTAR